MELCEKKYKVIDLINCVDNNIEYFDKSDKNSQTKIKSSLLSFKSSLENCSRFIEEIKSFAGEYDFDEETRGNGFWSFVDIFESAVKKTTKINKELITNREKILFRADSYAKYESPMTDYLKN
jgi:hypothetical protein